jgi:3-methyladenine DNA glycosylase AlkC
MKLALYLLLSCSAVLASEDRLNQKQLDLLVAVTKSDITAVKRLISEGASPHLPPSKSIPANSVQVPFVQSVYRGNHACFEYLLKHTDDGKIKDQYPDILIHAVNPHYSTSILTDLLKNGAARDYSDEQGATALHWAAINGFYEAIPILVEHGLSIDTKDKNGLLPVEWCFLKSIISIDGPIKIPPGRKLKTLKLFIKHGVEDTQVIDGKKLSDWIIELEKTNKPVQATASSRS